jgi:hypothetical protein
MWISSPERDTCGVGAGAVAEAIVGVAISALTSNVRATSVAERAKRGTAGPCVRFESALVMARRTAPGEVDDDDEMSCVPSTRQMKRVTTDGDAVKLRVLLEHERV